MPRVTIADLMAEIATLKAQVAPVTAQAAEHIGPSGKPDGRRFACTADGGCGRLLRSEKRASVHGVDDGGHQAAK
jgi:hypothetical protein